MLNLEKAEAFLIPPQAQLTIADAFRIIGKQPENLTESDLYAVALAYSAGYMRGANGARALMRKAARA